jgi:sigma-B regulation protein RsbU (phosphoserine phosphatase)
VQRALLPQELPKRLRGVDVAWHFDPARELGGDIYDFLSPEPHTLVVSVGDVSGKGVPAALYSAFVGELVRGRTFRRRLETRRSTPSVVLNAMNRILNERQLEEYYCTLCYAMFDLRRRQVTLANSGLPFPVRYSAGKAAAIPMPGVPLGSFAGSTYDELTLDLHPGDVFAFCSDGISETFNEEGHEFGAARVIEVVDRTHESSAKEIVGAIFGALQAFRRDAEQTDDQTVVVVKVTG